MKGQRAVGDSLCNLKTPRPGKCPHLCHESERCGNAYRPNAETHANSTEPQLRPRGTLDAVEKRANLISLVGNKAIRPRLV